MSIREESIYEKEFREKIVGAKVLAVSGHEPLKLETDRGTFLIDCVGDCCSSSWFETVEDDTSILVGEVITDWVEHDMPYPEDDSQYDHLQVYGGSLVTRKGRFSIEMRNDSNGYYGGNFVFREVGRIRPAGKVRVFRIQGGRDGYRSICEVTLSQVGHDNQQRIVAFRFDTTSTADDLRKMFDEAETGLKELTAKSLEESK